MSQRRIILRLTLAQKIGGIVAFLIFISLIIIIIYSIVSLKKIQAELKELTYLDFPLTKISNALEIYQLEQHIHSSQ